MWRYILKRLAMMVFVVLDVSILIFRRDHSGSGVGDDRRPEEKIQYLYDPDYPRFGRCGALPKLTGDEKRLSPVDGMPPDPTNLPDGCKFSPRCPHATDRCRSGDIPNVELTPGHFCRCVEVVAANATAKEVL